MKAFSNPILCVLLSGLLISGSAGASSVASDPEPGPICIIFPELCGWQGG